MANDTNRTMGIELKGRANVYKPAEMHLPKTATAQHN